MARDLPALVPGDFLLYRGHDVVSLGITLVTASFYSHIEHFDGDGRSWASRNLIGVGHYPLRTDGLSVVLRLRDHVPYRHERAVAWWRSVDGQGYDFLGLAVSRLPWLQGKALDTSRQFCSEACTRAVRWGIGGALDPVVSGLNKTTLADRGLDLFAGHDADGIYPGLFADCPLLRVVWRA